MPIKVFQPPKTVSYVDGATVLGLKICNVTDLIQQLERGLEPNAFMRLANHLKLPRESLLDHLGFSSRTFKTALKNGHLSRAKSTLLYRVGRIFERTLQVFHGNEVKAAHWLTTPKFGLNNEIPLRFARTEVGSECVLELLEELIDGGVA